MFEPINSLFLIEKFHKNLPDRIRRYLNGRGIADSVIDLHLLGWNSERITIPVFDRDGKLAFFKLAKDPEDTSLGPKMKTTLGGSAELYGWERIRVKPCRIVICEGEFDRLALESNGFGAVTSTGGAGTFRPEWAEAIREIPEVYVCFDRDEAGRNGAARVANMIPHANIVELPEEVGERGDVTDYFVRLGKSADDFQRLLGTARPRSEEVQTEQTNPSAVDPIRQKDNEIDRLKSSLAIEDLVGRYVPLRQRGQNLVGHCPFHEDHTPSFVVFSLTRTFHCFGCRAHGDVLTFLMHIEQLTFSEALQVLRDLTHHQNDGGN